MDPERPVIVRTSASAQDIWSRPYHDSQISPDGRILSNSRSRPRLDNSDTPFGRQQRPTFSSMPRSNVSNLPSRWPSDSSVVSDVMSSRECERLVYKGELQTIELNQKNEKKNVIITDLLKQMKVMQKENTDLQKKNAHLNQQLVRCLKINHATMQAMQQAYTWQRQ